MSGRESLQDKHSTRLVRSIGTENRRSAARQAIPAAWHELVDRGDELLVELLTDAVESKSGIRPDEKDVLKFLTELAVVAAAISPTTPSPRNPLKKNDGTTGFLRSGLGKRPAPGTTTGRVWDIADEISARTEPPALRKAVLTAAKKAGINQNTASTQYGRWARSNGLTRARVATIREADKAKGPTEVAKSGFIRAGSGVLHGKEFSYGSAKEAMVFILSELAKADSTFLHRCSQHPAFRGRTRRYVAQRAADLYPGRPDMIKKHDVLPGGWVVGTHLDNRSKMRIIRGAAEVAGITFGRDLIVEL